MKTVEIIEVRMSPDIYFVDVEIDHYLFKQKIHISQWFLRKASLFIELYGCFYAVVVDKEVIYVSSDKLTIKQQEQ